MLPADCRTGPGGTPGTPRHPRARGSPGGNLPPNSGYSSHLENRAKRTGHAAPLLPGTSPPSWLGAQESFLVKRKILWVLPSWGSLQPSCGVQHLGGCGIEGAL